MPPQESGGTSARTLTLRRIRSASLGGVVCLALCPGLARGQFVRTIPDEDPSIQSSAEGGGGPTWFGQAGLAAGQGLEPRLSVQVYQYAIEISNETFIPLYLLGSVPTIGGRDVTDVTSALLDEYGGAINLTMGTGEITLAPFGLFDFPNRTEMGLKLEVRAGTKLTDLSPAASGDTRLAFLGLGYATLRLNLPVWNVEDLQRTTRAGSLQMGLTGSAQWSNDQDYRTLLSDTDPLPTDLFYFNAFGSLILTDALYLSTQITLSASEDRFLRTTSFSLNYLR